MNNLSLSNVINVTLMPSVSGLSEFNTANLFLLSFDTPTKQDFTSGFRVYKSLPEVSADFAYDSLTVKMATAVFSQTPNILSNSGSLIIGLPNSGETQQEAFLRFSTSCLFCGFMTTDTIANDLEANIGDGSASSSSSLLPDIVASFNNKLNFIVIKDDADISSISGINSQKTRVLYYGTENDADAKAMMAAYASRAMSTIFEGSLTTQTMHLKELVGIEPDSTMNQTLLNSCVNAGIDTYVSIEGVPCVFTSGKNGFFDEVFNELWFVNAIQTAGFNYLRQTNFKIPQTEKGMTGLKNAYAQVCVRGVNNGFIGAGSWTSPDTFGNPETFKKNIEVSGFYIYSLPVAEQPKADREERKAPLVQIAVKAAGAIHSTNVLIYVNL